MHRAIQGLDLPNNPLDQLIDLLGGPAAVAEMTGRKGRLVRRKTGEAGVKWEARNASGVAAGSSLEMINIHERKMFLDGEKLVAVISEAASAGISLHADRLEGYSPRSFAPGRFWFVNPTLEIVTSGSSRWPAGIHAGAVFPNFRHIASHAPEMQVLGWTGQHCLLKWPHRPHRASAFASKSV